MTESASDVVVATMVGDEDWAEVEPFLDGLIEKKRNHADLLAAFASDLPTRNSMKECQRLCSQLQAGDNAALVFDEGDRISPVVISLLTLELDELSDSEASNFVGNLTESANTSQAITRTFNFPAIFLGVLTLYGMFVCLFLVPVFGEIYSDFELPLPPPTKWLLDFSQHAAILCALVFCNLALWFSRSFVVPKTMRMELSIRIPVLGKLYRHAYASRFCDVASVLLHSKSPVPACLRIAGKATLPGSLASQIEAMTLNRNALPLNRVDAPKYGLPRRLCVALESLTNRQSAERLLIEFGQDFRLRASAPSSRVFEPLCMIVLGLTAGFVVIALMMPLVALIQNLSG